MELTPIGQALTLLGTLGGIFVVFYILRWFQNDFIAVNRRELEGERKRADVADHIADAERAMRIKCQLHISKLERLLTYHGIEFPSDDT